MGHDREDEYKLIFAEKDVVIKEISTLDNSSDMHC